MKTPRTARTFPADDMYIYQRIFRTFDGADAYMAVFRSFMEFTQPLEVKLIL